MPFDTTRIIYFCSFQNYCIFSRKTRKMKNEKKIRKVKKLEKISINPPSTTLKIDQGAIDLESCLKVLRQLAAEQCNKRALIKKIHEARRYTFSLNSSYWLFQERTESGTADDGSLRSLHHCRLISDLFRIKVDLNFTFYFFRNFLFIFLFYISNLKIWPLDLYQSASFFCLYFAAEPQRSVFMRQSRVQKQLQQKNVHKNTLGYNSHFEKAEECGGKAETAR